VEIAIAIMILALGVIPLISVFISNSQETRANKNRSIAAALATSVLERYRRFRPDSIQGFTGAVDPNAATVPAEAPEIANDPVLTPKDAKDSTKAFFDLVKQLGFARVASYKKVSKRVGELTCTVFWREDAGAGRERVMSYSLATMLTDPIYPMGREDPGN